MGGKKDIFFTSILFPHYNLKNTSSFLEYFTKDEMKDIVVDSINIEYFFNTNFFESHEIEYGALVLNHSLNSDGSNIEKLVLSVPLLAYLSTMEFIEYYIEILDSVEKKSAEISEFSFVDIITEEIRVCNWNTETEFILSIYSASIHLPTMVEISFSQHNHEIENQNVTFNKSKLHFEAKNFIHYLKYQSKDFLNMQCDFHSYIIDIDM